MGAQRGSSKSPIPPASEGQLDPGASPFANLEKLAKEIAEGCSVRAQAACKGITRSLSVNGMQKAGEGFRKQNEELKAYTAAFRKTNPEWFNADGSVKEISEVFPSSSISSQN